MCKIRPYRARDFDACVAIMHSNVPRFFAPSEAAEFQTFLQGNPPPYLLLEIDGQAVACGGYFIRADKRAAGLCWGMVARTHHKQGLGTKLLAARIDAIRASGDADQILIDTSQHSAPFYKRFGFIETGRTPDGYGKGLDQVDMTLTL